MEEKKEAKPVQQQEKPKRLEDMSVVELKAVAYNLIRQLEITQTNLKTVNAASTKQTPGDVKAWIKVNINGTKYYIPAYQSKTS